MRRALVSNELSIILFALVCAFIITNLAGCREALHDIPTKENENQNTRRYHCPMHPSYVSDRPGNCPICGMSLVEIKNDERSSIESQHSHHHHHESSHNLDEASPPTPQDRAKVQLTRYDTNELSFAFSKALITNLIVSIKSPAILAHNEAFLHKISPRFNGWIIKLYVTYEGEVIKTGTPLFEFYSPEVFITEAEYLSSIYSDGSTAHKDNLQKLALSKLEYFEISKEEINKLIARKAPYSANIYRSTVSGHIISKNVYNGQHFNAGETLFEIGTLSSLWAKAYLPKEFLPMVHTNIFVNMYFYELNTNKYGKLFFISPHVDETSQRGELKIEIENNDMQLKPGMFAELNMEYTISNTLAIPFTAVMDTGKKKLVFVKDDDGSILPRYVQTGFRSGDLIAINSGIEEGEEVVSFGNFVIDAESQIQSAISSIGQTHQH